MSSQNLLDLKKRNAPTPVSPQRRTYRVEKPRGRRSPLRQRRRRKRALGTLIALLGIAGIAYGASYLSYLPQYTVTRIEVQGAQAVPASVIGAYVDTILYDGSYHFFSRQNIFLYPKPVIERDLVRNFPRIASANIARSSLLAQVITVTVTERQPYALWCGESGACYLMDGGGFIYSGASSDAATNSGYTFTGGIATSSPVIGQTFAPGHLPGLVALFALLSKQNGLDPSGASVEGGQDFTVPLAQGFSLRASYGENVDSLSRNLSLILSSDALRGQAGSIEYIDLRFGDRVYYKMKGEERERQ